MYVIVDKDGAPLRDELEIEGLITFEKDWDARNSIEWMIQDSIANAYRGLRIEVYDPRKHGEYKHA
jgi:hypothetical protein